MSLVLHPGREVRARSKGASTSTGPTVTAAPTPCEFGAPVILTRTPDRCVLRSEPPLLARRPDVKVDTIETGGVRSTGPGFRNTETPTTSRSSPSATLIGESTESATSRSSLPTILTLSPQLGGPLSTASLWQERSDAPCSHASRFTTSTPTGRTTDRRTSSCGADHSRVVPGFAIYSRGLDRRSQRTRRSRI